ncbi:MAG: SecDF P1 head subdomain-containing protein [Nocardioides sp.]
MRTASLLALLALSATLVTGCGSGDQSSSTGAPTSSGTPSAPPVNALEFGVHSVVARFNKGVPLGPQVPKDVVTELSSHDCSSPASTVSDGSEIACDPGGSVYLLKPPAVSGHVQSAQAQEVGTTKQWYVAVQLDPTGTSQLSDLTADLVGSEIALTVRGDVVGAPVVYQRLTDGKLSVLGNYGKSQATRLASSLTRG